MKIKYLAAVLIGIAGLGLQQAKADTFNFTSDHCTGGCGPQPFGTVTLTQVGNDVNVVVSLFNGNKFVETGAGNNNYFLFDNAGITLANITNISAPFAPGALTATIGGHADGTGNWMWGITCPTCGTGGGNAILGPISFTVTNTTLAAMEVGHSVSGFGTELFVADILSGTTGNTGPVDVNTPAVVPDGGATVMLLGGALGALGIARRYLKR